MTEVPEKHVHVRDEEQGILREDTEMPDGMSVQIGMDVAKNVGDIIGEEVAEIYDISPQRVEVHALLSPNEAKVSIKPP